MLRLTAGAEQGEGREVPLGRTGRVPPIPGLPLFKYFIFVFVFVFIFVFVFDNCLPDSHRRRRVRVVAAAWIILGRLSWSEERTTTPHCQSSNRACPHILRYIVSCHQLFQLTTYQTNHIISSLVTGDADEASGHLGQLQRRRRGRLQHPGRRGREHGAGEPGQHPLLRPAGGEGRGVHGQCNGRGGVAEESKEVC